MAACRIREEPLTSKMSAGSQLCLRLFRDVPFTDDDKNKRVKNAAKALDDMPRKGIAGARGKQTFTPQNRFRGEGPGVLDGPLMSQFLLASNAKLQSGLPHQKNSSRTKGFAQFGGPHILTLVTKVATRALKAVRFQKFTKHRRGRPEQLAGLTSQYKYYEDKRDNPFAPMKPLVENLECVMFGDKPLLQAVYEHNNGAGYFLPMAFPEGSPMHPSYGAGHATVAGACVTTLKAFFDTSREIDTVFVPRDMGRKLKHIPCPQPLTLEGELNKLAANVSIGRNMAGGHYYTDYSESLKMGEQIAIGVSPETLAADPTNQG